MPKNAWGTGKNLLVNGYKKMKSNAMNEILIAYIFS
jgi:hypothetical protein